MSATRHRTSVAIALSAVVLLALSAIDATSTRAAPGDPEMWPGTWAARGPEQASILAADERGSVAAGYGGEIVALGPDGTEIWRSTAGGDEVGNDLALLPDLVVVPSNDRVTAFDRATGAPMWERPAEASRVGAGEMPDGTTGIVIASPGGAVVLADAASGDEVLRATIPSPRPDGAPFVWLSGESLVVAWSARGSCCYLGAFDSHTGALRWRRKVTHDSAVPIVHRGLVVVAENERRTGDGVITAYDVDRGARRWSTPVDAEFAPSLWSDAAGPDVVIAAMAGSLIDIEVGSGRVRWVSDPVEPSDEAHPKIAGARVFLTPANTGAVEIDRATGAVLGAGPLRPDVYVFDTAGIPGRFELLVGDGLSFAVWAFEPATPRAASETG
jgi:outer membrane protein assembly factor BamB